MRYNIHIPYRKSANASSILLHNALQKRFKEKIVSSETSCIEKKSANSPSL